MTAQLREEREQQFASPPPPFASQSSNTKSDFVYDELTQSFFAKNQKLTGPLFRGSGDGWWRIVLGGQEIFWNMQTTGMQHALLPIQSLGLCFADYFDSFGSPVILVKNPSLAADIVTVGGERGSGAHRAKLVRLYGVTWSEWGIEKCGTKAFYSSAPPSAERPPNEMYPLFMDNFDFLIVSLKDLCLRFKGTAKRDGGPKLMLER